MKEDRNRTAMLAAGVGLFLWLALLHAGCTAEAGALRWHPHMHWFDKFVWYGYMAVGPVLVGFMLGLRVAVRKVYRKCHGCGRKFDAERMTFFADPVGEQPGHWGCRKCVQVKAT